MEDKTPVQVRLPNDELAALDCYRRQQSNPPSRATAARDLIRQAIEHVLPANNTTGAAA